MLFIERGSKMPMTFTLEPADLKVVQHVNTEQWFVLDLNEGDVISKPFATLEQAEAEMAILLTL
jgi:hypothetical protein